MRRAVGARARARRLALGLTQAEVGERAGLGSATVKRFEHTGQMAFDGIVRLAIALDAAEAIVALFDKPVAAIKSLDEILEKPARQRGRRRVKA